MINKEILGWQNRVQSPIEKALRRAYHLGQTYEIHAKSESYPQNEKSKETAYNLEALVVEMEKFWNELTKEN